MAGANAGEIRARMTLDNADFKAKMQEARNELKQARTDAKQYENSMRELGMAGAVMAGAAVTAIGAAVAVAAQFEQSMAKVKAVSGATDAQFAELEKTAIQLGATTTFSATQAADGMGILAMAGFETNEIIAAMPATMNLAAAAGVGLAQSADIMSATMSGFQIKAEDTGHAVDVMVSAMNQANLDLPDLGEAMKYVAPVAAAFQMKIEDVTAAIALMSNYGIKGSIAGTALRAGFLSLANPVGQAEEAIAALNLKLKDQNGELLSLPAMVGEMAKKMEGLTDTQKASYMAQLVGVEASSAFLTLLKEGQPAIEEFATKLEDSEGAAQKMADVMNDTLIGSWQELTGAVESAGIAIGKEFIPALRSILGAGTGIIGMFSKVDPSIAATGLKATLAAGGVLLLGSALGTATKAFNILRLAFISNPFGLALLGIAGLTAGYIAYKDGVDRANEVNLEHYNTLDNQQRKLEDTITAFDDLRGKCKLSTDELLLYVDMQKQMQNTSDPTKVQQLSDAMGKLQEKSGLSKDELDKLIGLNDDLIKQAPNTETAINKSGNAFAKSTEAAKELNSALIEQKRIELELQAMKLEAKVDTHIRNYKQAVDDTNTAIQARNQGLIDQAGLEYNIETLQKRIADAKAAGQDRTAVALQDELQRQMFLLNTQQDKNVKLQEEYIQKRESLQKSSEQLTKDQEIYTQINQNLLAQVGLTAEKGREKQKIDESINSLTKQRDEIIKNAGGAGKLTAEQQKSVEEINKQIGRYQEAGRQIDTNTGKQDGTNKKIEDGKTKAGEMTKELSKDASKKIKFTGDGMEKAKQISDEAGKPVEKHVTIWERTVKWVEEIFSGGDKPKRHNGGLLHDLPKFHSGGSPNLNLPQINAPKMDEVDVRILRDELVLTKGQQYNLFGIIKAFNAAQAQTIQNAAQTQSTGDGGVKIEIGSLVVREQADVQRIADELNRLSEIRRRGRGGR